MVSFLLMPEALHHTFLYCQMYFQWDEGSVSHQGLNPTVEWFILSQKSYVRYCNILHNIMCTCYIKIIFMKIEF